MGYYLRATVSYKDREGDGKSAVGTSANEVKGFNSPNAAPVFPDQDSVMSGDQSDEVTLEVGENAEKGDNVGDPVKARGRQHWRHTDLHDCPGERRQHTCRPLQD